MNTPRPKFTPEYRVYLSSVVVNCMQKECKTSGSEVLRQATIIAQQHLTSETENAQRAAARAATIDGKAQP